MTRPDSFRRFALRVLAVLVLLVLPWPGATAAYRGAFRALASALLCGTGERREVSFAPDGETKGRGALRLVIWNPELMAADGSGPIRHLDINALELGWHPTALFLALTCAMALPWKRRGKMAVVGIIAVHAYAMGALCFAIWNEASHLGPAGVAQNSVLDRLEYALLSQVSLAVPVIAWMLALPRLRRVAPPRAEKRRPLAPAALALLAGVLLLPACDRQPPAVATAPASPSPTPQVLPDLEVLPPRVAGQMPRPVTLDEAFECPPEWQDKYGNFRSPLEFYDGSRVEKTDDWPRRRAEIRRRWDELLGAWPEAIAKPGSKVLESTEQEGFTRQRVLIELAPHLSSEGWLLLPTGSPGPRPAVLVLTPYAAGALATSRPFVEVAVELARRGFVTLTLGPPGGNPRQPQIFDAPCQPLSYLGYMASNAANLLANMPEVDPARIGVFGHGYGGKWAMFASCLGERFACAVWSEAGIVFDESKGSANYNELWYLAKELSANPGERSREFGRPEPMHREGERWRAGAYRELHNLGLDLPELHALMAPRPFLVSAGTSRLPSAAATCADDESRWMALNHAIEVNRLLGYEHRVAMTNRATHELTAASKAQAFEFFARFLK